jgi:hypothetical protein
MPQQRGHVAKIAVERTAARELDADRVVIPEIRQLPERDGGLVDIGELRRGVDAASLTHFKVAQERSESLLGFIQDK